MSGFKTRLFFLKRISEHLLFLCSIVLPGLLAILVVIGMLKPPMKAVDNLNPPAALLVYSWEAQASSHLSAAQIRHASDTGTQKDILLMVWNVKPCLLAGKISVSAMPNQAMKWVQRGLRETLRIALLPSPASRCLRPDAESRPGFYKQSIAADSRPYGQIHEHSVIESNQDEVQIQPTGASAGHLSSPNKIDTRHAV
ncbi:hypothetical protein KC222_02990 [Cedecea davisae]|uniref:Uncharacterized protein n=1 Tax=Cedecea davisae TaxID=158484 RepID=A0ABS6DCQ5_9ENTR|nr:hypothetical protein [Cedecea davisae]MBU4680978.1 hypothetical protein [Cedecea davisae]MBU4687672.1 hypothetical protein [Cedecea davisae]